MLLVGSLATYIRRGKAASVGGLFFILRKRSASFPSHPGTPNVWILPNHVTAPIGVTIVESNVEPRRQPREGCRIKIDTSPQCVQIIHDAIVHNARIVDNLNTLGACIDFNSTP